MDEKSQPPSNRLINERSPYLLQHARNPVNWYPWGEEALEKAKKEDKPIFLSIGYATCHWCHVMAHESFEDEDIAHILNRDYVAVKVDREERPDIDKIYMTVCQALTGSGGWPLSIFMTPEGKPFFAGTYFPKTTRMGATGFTELLNQIATLWEKDRGRITDAGNKITQAIQPRTDDKEAAPPLDKETLRKGYTQLARSFDPKWGGFGNAPKFPTPHNLTFLLRWFKKSGDKMALEMVEKTLNAMRNGGMYDQIGFGFHRYSVDGQWLVPHFEKMLYDQALLAIAYTETYQVTGNDAFARVAREIFTYVLRDMTSPEGGFYSAEDADSEGKEGLFYLCTPEEVKKYTGEEAGDLFCRFFDIREGGNFEDGLSIPHIILNARAFAEKERMDIEKLDRVLAETRNRLFEVREKRIHPLKDDKILTSWNGLMIAAFAKGYQVFGDKIYADAAKASADFILNTLRSADGRLLRRYRKGNAAFPAYLDDYAFMVWGLIELYEATFETSYLREAHTLNGAMVDIFWDKKSGGLFFTGKGNEPLITLSKEIYDGALPSGNSVAALNFMRLARMTGDVGLEQRAEAVMTSFSKQVAEHPMGYTQFMAALDFMVGPSREIVIAGDTSHELTQAMLHAVRKRFLPDKVLLLGPDGEADEEMLSLSPFLKFMRPINHRTTAYVCEQFTCQKPVTEVKALEAILGPWKK